MSRHESKFGGGCPTRPPAQPPGDVLGQSKDCRGHREIRPYERTAVEHDLYVSRWYVLVNGKNMATYFDGAYALLRTEEASGDLVIDPR